ncbi:DUF4192 domain-containing protein [Paenarthrobacter histidinolovorans]|uniref:DUF4192 domain-containing protein n=1 Tax=Paenarthrobacter histidinolovorans TaxID=43664 RepID=UPI00166CC7DA|nr:DUF4192 domain-containing protein [Paenarthrobacter histidinolovorans]GGJ20734.1 hypothetical protein GCM10010052_17490 [Paenarthrobacter histidinolovorans]
MTTNKTLSIHQPEDILGYIPHMLGYWPEESLVAITMQGKLLGATLRVDLPAVSSKAAIDRFAEHVRHYLIADEAANGVVLAVYTDDGWNDGSVVSRTTPLLDSLRASLDCVDLAVRDAWLVGADYWRGAYCVDEGCCPLPGFPVERIKESRLSAELVYQGSAIGPSPRKGFEGLGFARSSPHESQVSEAEVQFGQSMLGRWRSEACFDAVLTVWRHVMARALRNDPLDPVADATLIGLLRTTLKVPAWRDAVVVMAAAGTDAAKSGAEGFELFDEDGLDTPPFDLRELGVPDVRIASKNTSGAAHTAGSGETADVYTYGDVLLGMRPEVPCWSDLDMLQQALARLTVEGEQGEVAAAALTLQGWIFWCRGNGSLAHACLRSAEDAQPGYRLAELLMGILGEGVLCGWARRPSTACSMPRNSSA